MVISWYLQENGEDDYLDDDPNYVVTDVPKKYIVDNDANESNENDDGYDVGIDDDDGSHWCFYWDCGCFSSFSMLLDTYCYFCDYPSSYYILGHFDLYGGFMLTYKLGLLLINFDF